jgi:hypothetical protein
MKTCFRNSFGKDHKKITDKTLNAEIKQAIFSVENAAAIKDIPNVKKLKGAKKGIF